MRGAKEHGEIVLTAIIGGRGSVRALDYVMSRIGPDQFEDSRQQALITLLHGYATQTHGICTSAALEDLLRDKPPGSRMDLVAYYDLLAGRPLPQGHEFKHSVAQLAELAARRDTGTALAAALEILNHGVWEDDKTHLKGHEDARAYLLGEFDRIEQEMHLSDSPEGDAHDDAMAVLDGYARAKALQLNEQAPGVLFGIGSLDAYLDGGLSNGEMAVIRAGTTIGKSRFCIQWAWDASVKQGKNVIYFTTETLRPEICINLIARHSCLPQFGLANGLNSRAIRAGRLSPADEKALDMVVTDFKSGNYGRLRVVQMPENCTMTALATRYAAIEKMYTPDLVIADYLQLFEPERRSKDARDFENLSGILKRAQRWCGTCSNGRGVVFGTPWQVNRAGRANLRATGGYTLEDSAGSQEASNTPDLVLDLLDREEDTSNGRRAPLEVGVAKSRGGPRGKRFPVEADYATCHFTERNLGDAEMEMALEEMESADA
jgi:replicative DNA helicase